MATQELQQFQGVMRGAQEVPDLAMVPRFLTRSSLVMPMPRSRMVSMLRAGSSLIWISSFAWSPSPRRLCGHMMEELSKFSHCKG